MIASPDELNAVIRLVEDLRTGCAIALNLVTTPGGLRVMKRRVESADRALEQLRAARAAASHEVTSC